MYFSFVNVILFLHCFFFWNACGLPRTTVWQTLLYSVDGTNTRVGFNWLRIGTDGGLLWVRWWTFGFLRHGVSCSQVCEINIDRKFAQLTEEEWTYAWLQQDLATAHATDHSLVEEVSGDGIVRRGSWLARSPDLAHCDFSLCGNLRDEVYRTKLHTKVKPKET
jgi:hypothetical protein